MTIERYPTHKPLPFADAVRANGFLFLSGQVAMTISGIPLMGNITEQTEHIMKSIEGTLANAGATLADVVRVQVWLSSMEHFAEFNAEYRKWFTDGFPARSVTSSRLAFDMDVEIEVQAIAR